MENEKFYLGINKGDINTIDIDKEDNIITIYFENRYDYDYSAHVYFEDTKTIIYTDEHKDNLMKIIKANRS